MLFQPGIRGIVERIISKLREFTNQQSTIFLWLFALTFLSFGILIPALGFYWDDLPYLFQFSAFGPGGFPDYVSSDRPFSAWIFSATTALFGYQPLWYHILALLLRWICASLFYLILHQLWPNRRNANRIAAAIFAIYPGFLQQPIALIYNHHFSVLAMFLSSVLLMIVNLKREKPRLLPALISILLSFSMFSIENFAMLELVRPFIIWKIIREKNTAKTKIDLRKILQQWLPYLAVLVFFLIWRVFIFKFPTYKPAGVASVVQAPLQAVGGILSRIPHDFYTVYINAWITNLYLPTVSDFGRMATYLFWAVVVGSAGLIVFFFSFLNNEKNSAAQAESPKKFAIWEQLAGSLLLFLLAGSIVWGLDLPLENKFAWDRMTLAFIPGVALLGGFLFAFLDNKKAVQVALLALLFALASGLNYQNGIAFKRDWDNLQNFLTQLSWRIPALAENTIFITSEPGLNYYSDNSLTSPINLQYSDSLSDQELSHFVYNTTARTEEWFEDDLFDVEYRKRYRSFIFYGNTGSAIAYRFEPPSCLQILDRKFANSITTPNMTDRQVKEVRFTDLDLILQEPVHAPFSPLFSAAETGSWCYYFEKADLSRQFGDYAEVVRLGNSALAEGKSPRTPSEWLPFLEGYLWQGDFSTAQTILHEIARAEGNYTSGVCYTLRRIAREAQYPFPEDISGLIKEHSCQE
jgi:hypothetical protein